MTVNLFGRSSSYQPQPGKDRRGLRAERGLGLPADARGQHRGAGPAHAGAAHARPLLAERAETIETRWGLPARKWLRVFKPVDPDRSPPMSRACRQSLRPHRRVPQGPLDWRSLVRVAEPGRRHFRRGGAAHHRALRPGRKRPASAGAAGRGGDGARQRRQAAGHRVAHAVAGRPRRPGLPAHRPAQGGRGQGGRHHERRLCRAPPGAAGAGERQPRWWWPPPSPSSPTGSTRSSASRAARVRRVVASPQDIHRYTAEFFALAKSVRAAQKAGGNAGARQLRATGGAGQEQQAARRQRPGRGAGGGLALDTTRSTSAPATSTWSRGASRA